MVQAASALPLMILVQLLHSFFVVDIHVVGRVVYLDRAVFVASLVFYAAWMLACSKAPDRWVQCLGPLSVLGLFAIFIEQRAVAIPIIWALQAAILGGLAAWAYSVRDDRWQLVHLAAATIFHGVGCMTFYPICQIGMGGLYIPPDNFRLACDTVIGPLLSGGLFAAAGVTWISTVGAHAVLARRRV
jgi:hypothetical protein